MPRIIDHRDEAVHGADGETRRTVTQHRTVSPTTYSEQVAVVDSGRHWYEFDLAGRINAVLFAILLGLETLLAVRFTLFAFGANPNSGFVDFIYDFSGFFREPFENAFANRTWDEGIIEVSALLALGVYAIVFAFTALLVVTIVPRIGGYRDDGTDATYRRTRVTHSGTR